MLNTTGLMSGFLRRLPLATVFLASVALAGCTAEPAPAPAEPSETAAVDTASPASTRAPYERFEPVLSEPPQSAGEALADAERLVRKYYLARSHVWRKPQDRDVILIYAQGPQADTDLRLAEEREQVGLITSGWVTFSPDMEAAYAQSWTDTIDGQEVEVPYGHVTIPGCHDITELKAEMPGKGPIPTTGPLRFHAEATIAYDQIGGRWLLIDINTPADGKTEC
ncbi:MAG: hypothetical protein Q4E05_07590 [Pseudoclavibacter sp.]|nr:hypothetical protein [Pseudoclavibacter sp.]